MQSNQTETISVSNEEVPVSGEYDVIVCGGGPAGIGAAIMLARNGAKTLLIEQLAFLGGVATGAFIYHWMDTVSGPIHQELVDTMINNGTAERNYNPELHYQPGRIAFHSETLKVIALRMVQEAGADVLLCTFAESTFVEDDTVKGVFIANKGGRSLIKAKVVIDSSADGNIAVSAGAAFLKGDPEDGRLQQVNFKWQMSGEDWNKYEKNKPSEDTLLELIKNAHETGAIKPPTGAFRPEKETFPYHRSSQLLALTKWEIENVDCSDPIAVSNTLQECQLAAFDVVEFCRKHIPGFENCRVARFPALLGTRESRRIIGKYILTKDDVLNGQKFDDGVAKASFFMDFHDSPPGTTIPYSIEYKKANRPEEGDWYEIPYRCLVPEKIKGLLVAGRCISTDRHAQASMRVQTTCMYTGSAAGKAAAQAVKNGVLPHELDGKNIE